MALYANRSVNAMVQVPTSWAYEANGNGAGSTADGPFDLYDPVGFGGQWGYYRDYTGLYLLTHRYYDAGVGRFVTRDPIGYGGGINLYGFAGNNPVNRMDPEGTDPPDFGAPFRTFYRKVLTPIGRLFQSRVQAKAKGYDLTPTVQTTPAVDPGASPDARASEEEAQEVERTQRPFIPGGVGRSINVPKPVFPSSPAPLEMGRIVGWGTGPEGAISRMKRITPEDVTEMQKQGLTLDDAKAWAKAYTAHQKYMNAHRQETGIAGPSTPLYRALLMHKIT